MSLTTKVMASIANETGEEVMLRIASAHFVESIEPKTYFAGLCTSGRSHQMVPLFDPMSGEVHLAAVGQTHQEALAKLELLLARFFNNNGEPI